MSRDTNQNNRRNVGNRSRSKTGGRRNSAAKRGGNSGRRTKPNPKRRKRRSLKAPSVIIFLLGLYVIVYFSMYLSKEKIDIYEVNSGNLSENNIFTAFAIRDEKIHNALADGNINYFVVDGARASTGTIVYTVDETGRVASMIESMNETDNAMSENNLSSIKNSLTNYKKEYSDSSFYKIYDLEDTITSVVMDAVNENVVGNLDDIIKNTASDNHFIKVNAEETGIITYYVDGYEDYTINNITAECFDKEAIKTENLRNTGIVINGNPVYKQILSEDWDMVIQLNDKIISDFDLASKNRLRIRFVRDDITTYANFKIVTTSNGTYGLLSLSKFMIKYANDRLLDVEIMATESDGLKIPKSAVVTKDFYVIPREIIADSDDNYVELEVAKAGSGAVKKKYKIYAEDEDNFYLEMRDFEAGEYIIQKNTQENYAISKTAPLQGVYCVNMGYAVFRKIEKIDENEEYIIVSTGTRFGLSIYDHIILNGSTVDENQIIY